MTVAWVTGGGTGIGRSLAFGLFREGASVVISGRRQDVLEQTQRDIAALPGRGQILAIPGDAFDAAHVRDVLARVSERWGDITLLINNAGANLDQEASETSFQLYQKSLEMNCLTAIRATEAVLPAMRRADRGAIINISSIYGKWASGRSRAYSVGKYALAGYTDALRQSLVGTQVYVMGVYPGFIKTAMTMPFVRSGSLRAAMGKTPDQLAEAVLAAWQRQKTELYYPWYVPWVLRLHRWMPVLSDRLAFKMKQ